MISLFCCLNEKYQRYKLSKLLKKLDKPINIDVTSLRSKYTKSPRKEKTNNKIIINLSLTCTYDPDTHQLQVLPQEMMMEPLQQEHPEQHLIYPIL